MNENRNRKFYDAYDDSEIIPEDFNFLQNNTNTNKPLSPMTVRSSLHNINESNYLNQQK